MRRRGGYIGRQRGGIDRDKGAKRVRLRLTMRRERKGGREVKERGGSEGQRGREREKEGGGGIGRE
jgi:hypothetical protein